MNIVMNILWIVLGGLFICIEYIIASLLLMVTIIGIPFGLQTLKLSVLALCPFGMQVRSCPGGEGCLSVLMNILWILVGGIWISLSHLAFGLLLCITLYKSDSGPLGIRCSILYVFYHMFSIFQTLQSTGKEVC